MSSVGDVHGVSSSFDEVSVEEISGRLLGRCLKQVIAVTRSCIVMVLEEAEASLS